MVDQQVAGDGQQPGALRRPARIETAVGAQSALERGLREVLDGLPVERAVGQEAVDPPNVVVIETREVSVCMLVLDVLPLSPGPTSEPTPYWLHAKDRPCRQPRGEALALASVIGHISPRALDNDRQLW
jgi:hypothetical protein